MDVLNFLPVSKEDMENRGWWYYDFLVVTADAYIDHPSFGTAIIARVLEDAGVYKCTSEGRLAFERFINSVK